MNLEEALSRYFGFAGFQPGQREVIAHLLAGRSAAAVFPTGGGKSLCYQLPAQLLPGVTLVISPLIALMKDQIDALTARNLVARRLDSTLTVAEYRAVMDGVRSGEVRLLYVAPERFNNERFRAAMRSVRVSLFAVDEAHCISEWGHNFRPDYLKLVGYARELAAERVLALTATATPRVLDDVCRGFAIAPECAVRTGFHRENLELQLTPVHTTDRDAELLRALAQSPPGAAIVYVTLQRTAEQVATLLAQANLPARAYHAGMDAELRSEVQDWFLGSSRGIVVATIAFGMGIDKPDIRYVFHYNLPKSLENYCQEIGRAGRDGLPALCRMLVCPQDRLVLENFILGDTPTPDALRSLIAELFAADQGEELLLSQYDLSRRHDIRELVLRTLLTYLELEGYLAGGTPVYSSYRFIPHRSSAEILAHFPADKHAFLLDVFRCAQKGRTWFTIDVEEAAHRAASDRGRVIAALEHLAERGLIDLESSQVRNRYRLVRRPDDLPRLADQLRDRMVLRETAELARMRQVLDLVTLDRCQVKELCQHFGEELPRPCGHCTFCLHGRQQHLDPIAAPPIAADVLRDASQLAAGQPLLRDPVTMTRFLCGLASPRLAKERLTSHSYFGILEDVPYHDVLHATTHQLAAGAGSGGS